MENQYSDPRVNKQTLLSLIKQDFQMISLFSRLDTVGFSNVDFPSITYEIFDLMGIPEELRSDDLFETYDVWSRQMDWIKNEGERENHLIKVYQELSKLREFSYVHA
ncbi:MAG: hypothetical protein Roseis2KO_55210 [Roseivirga sp.]